ncbi:nucleotidyltransferase family protein [Cellulosimicrobium cellulans]|uniref:nucleotidyltransferase family protein n=1 Tax=Cellulosimicrobium cellulans TaxID=1710 RepID=UPI00084835F5|nr:nucleotidyltransferase family protein [Cellulosimicrobium cellulans]
MVDDREALHDGLRLTAAALAEAGIPHALVGGYAAWARGAPEPSHDADFAIREVDVERAQEVLRAAGLEITEPTENWLFKAYHGGELVDVLYRMVGEPIDDELLSRTDELEVLAVRMPVLSATEVMTSKLRVVGEHYCDFSRLLPVARAMREQVDWVEVRERVDDNPYARAFLFLLDELGVVDRAQMQDDGVDPLAARAGSGPASGDPSSHIE